MTVNEALHRKVQTYGGLLRLVSRAGPKWASLPMEVRAGGQLELQMLRSSETFLWRDDLLRASLVAAKSLPAPVTLSAEIPPTPSGFYFFSSPFSLDGVREAVSAIAWHPFGSDYFMFWLYSSSAKRFGELDAFTVFMLKHGSDVLVQPVEKFDSLDDARARGSHGTHLDLTNKTSGNMDSKIGADSVVRFLMASWLWLKQRVMVAAREDVNSGARKAAAKINVRSNVSVITLRRAESSPSSINVTGPTDWSCQWLVRGHWRQQFYRSTSERRPLWIEPYVKGPEDKPFKLPNETVFQVNR